MRRTTIALLLLPASLLAQTATAPEATTHLPVTHVSLYKNGVGFFEHTGHITGNAAVTIDFTDAQLDDVLQTLTAIDLNGGRIAGAGYNSTTPLEQQLKNLGLGLDEHTDYESLLTALHGARVSITGSGAPLTGRIVDIEAHTTGDSTASDTSTTTPTRAEYFLNVASESGDIRLFKVTPTLSVHLLDATSHTDLNQYLQLLDSTRSHGLRHLTLEDHGTGARELRLSYLSEVPIWKSTYRILFTDRSATSTDQTATLQGWSVVDNTTGTDWINVHLSLIAGAPQSFIQPLSQPIYSRRPEIPIAQEAQLTPQTFESGVDAKTVTDLPVSGRDVQTFVTMQPGLASPAMAKASRGAPGGVFGGTMNGNSFAPAAGGNAGGGVLHLPNSSTYEDASTASTTIDASTAAFDDYFSYNLTEPVTIRKNASALVPILQVKIPVDRVTLVSSNGNTTSQPLRALWITNTSNLTFDRGSFSLVENGNFGGEGLLDPIHPGEKRLLSYAADQAVHVATEGDKSNQQVTFLSGSKGVLNIHHAEFHEVTYVLHNAAAEDRTVVLEEPVVNGFKLDSENPGEPNTGSQDPRPAETTPTVYRFRIAVPAGQTVRVHSGAHRNGFTTYYLTRSDDNQFNLIVNQSDKNPALIAALQPILDARRKVADAQTAVDQTNKRLTDLRSDEDRQRANITALATADKTSRDRFVHDLNTTEDNITAAQKELTTHTTALEAAKANLAGRIDDFHIDTSKPATP
jgi:hypothetical protein